MTCSKFDLEIDDKSALKHFLFEVLAWHTGRNEKDEYNTIRISTKESDLYWNSHIKKSLDAVNPELVCVLCMPYKLNKRIDVLDHKMFIKGKKDDEAIIWKESSFEYLWEIIEDLMNKKEYEVVSQGFDGSTHESWGIYHNYNGTFIYKHSQYYGK